MKHNKHHLFFKHFLTLIFCSALCGLLLSANVYGDTCITCHTDEDLLEENLAEVEKKVSEMQAGSG
ncbi:MAG: hypothetical protein HKP52_03465 [Desulfofustis sp.]|nr:hypothetical protein [Desulfofustis sp.]MBT8346481.1 hypothetical protein [Desulfofustis sp.]MBT8353023.1 hypothetical protein [Desulfofustis sp.]NNF45971.1 hypothetical protein [Desulfofustis sp.]NNK13274.1 hypothetical protein [Desulfofustis sp.]